MSEPEGDFMEVGPPPPGLPEKRAYPIDLSDMKRATVFMEWILKEWNKEAVAHATLNEAGFTISSDTHDLEGLLKSLGSLEDVEYVSATVPGSLMVMFDFSEDSLRIECENDVLLSRLAERWTEVRHSVPEDASLRLVSSLTKARGFITSRVEQDGFFMERPGQRLELAQATRLWYLKLLGLSHLLNRFASRLLESQSSDGGWGSVEGKESDPLSTANAILVISSADGVDASRKSQAIERAVGFLFSKRRGDGSWSPDSAFLTTMQCTCALHVSGANRVLLRKPVSFLVNCLSGKAQVRAELYDLDLMITSGVVAQENWLHLSSELGQGLTMPAKDDILALSSALHQLVYKADAPDLAFHELLGHVFSLQKADGGWPEKPSGQSSLNTTLSVALLLQKVRERMSASGSADHE
jgi:hypothetical protein